MFLEEKRTGEVVETKPTVEGALAFFAANPDVEFIYRDIYNCAVCQYLTFRGLRHPMTSGGGACWVGGQWSFSRRFATALTRVYSGGTFGGIVRAYARLGGE